VLREMQLYCESDADGLAKFDGEVFRLTEGNRPFVRSVAAAFDAYLNADGARYSIAV